MRMKEGPVLPQRLANPCVIKINESSYMITSNSPYSRFATRKLLYLNETFEAWIYDFNSNKWNDISRGFPCSYDINEKIVCSKYSEKYLLISMLPIDGVICTAIFNLADFAWTNKNKLLVENPQSGIITNPLNDDNEAFFIIEKDVYKMIHFEWQLQWEMGINVNASTFVGQSMYRVFQQMCPTETGV